MHAGLYGRRMPSHEAGRRSPGREHLREVGRVLGGTAAWTWSIGAVVIALIASPMLWSDDLGRAYAIWSLTVGGVGVLAIVVVLVRGLVAVRRTSRDRRPERDGSA